MTERRFLCACCFAVPFFFGFCGPSESGTYLGLQNNGTGSVLTTRQ